MGNICFNDDTAKCVKCKDYFIIHYGGKSQRNSCRNHNWKNVGINKLCKTCNKYKQNLKCSNCYHVCYYEK